MSQKHSHGITKGLPKDIREIADSAIDHLGTMLDNMKISDWVDAAPYLAVAYLGYNVKNNPKDAAICMVALKLATSMGGTPPVSQITGLGILATYGIIAVTDLFGEVAVKEEARMKSEITVVTTSKGGTESEGAEYGELLFRYFHYTRGDPVTWSETDMKRLIELKAKYGT